MPRGRSNRTAEKRERFLAAVSDGHTVRHAAAVAGMSWRSAYDWRDEDPAFRDDWEEAVRQGAEAVEQEIRRRAIEGWEEPVFYQGEKVAVVRKYSDTLLIFLAKAHNPERFRERVDVHQTQDRAPSDKRSLDLRQRLGDDAWHEHAEAMAARVQEAEAPE